MSGLDSGEVARQLDEDLHAILDDDDVMSMEDVRSLIGETWTPDDGDIKRAVDRLVSQGKVERFGDGLRPVR